MRECIKKKLTKGYQFLDLPKAPKSPNAIVTEITSASPLGKRPGQVINGIEPDLTKKLNTHPSSTQPSPNVFSSETNFTASSTIGATKVFKNGKKSPRIELESPQVSISLNQGIQQTSSPTQMVEEILQNPKKAKIAPEKKLSKPELPKKDHPQIPLSTQIKEEKKNDKPNSLVPPVKLEFGLTNPALLPKNRGLINKSLVPPVKNEENSQGTKFLSSPTNNTLEQRHEEFRKKLKKVAPGDCPFGEPAFESHDYLTVPSKWENEDVTGWYISEKLGGIRCLWNGLEMWPKSGPQYNLPEFFIERLPKSPLDGELCMKGGSLSRCMMVVKKKPTDPDFEKEWNNMSFVVYDAPEAPGTFQQRLQALKEYFEKSDGLYVNLHEYKKCEGNSDAEKELKQEERKGGEGILLTNPNGEYVKGKSKNVLERKSKFEGRAIVKEVIRDKEKPQIITSLRVENVKGIEFMINRGITDDLRKNPPKVGDEIVYEYKGILDSEKPKAPVLKNYSFEV